MESEKSLVGKVGTSWGWESGAAMQVDVFSLCSSVSRGLGCFAVLPHWMGWL